MKCLLLTSLLFAITGCGASGSIEPASVLTTDTCVFPAHFVDQIDQEVEYKSVDTLPISIQIRLREYLTDRVGTDFLPRLRFRVASFVDPTLVPEVVRMHKQLGRVYVAYVVLFDLPLSDGSSYCAGVHMTAEGDVVMDIGVPKIATSQSKRHIISRSEAEAIAKRQGLTDPLQDPFTSLRYSTQRDSLVWEIAEISTSAAGHKVFASCMIDAHTGQFLAWESNDVVF